MCWMWHRQWPFNGPSQQQGSCQPSLDQDKPSLCSRWSWPESKLSPFLDSLLDRKTGFSVWAISPSYEVQLRWFKILWKDTRMFYNFHVGTYPRKLNYLDLKGVLSQLIWLESVRVIICFLFSSFILWDFRSVFWLSLGVY